MAIVSSATASHADQQIIECGVHVRSNCKADQRPLIPATLGLDVGHMNLPGFHPRRNGHSFGARLVIRRGQDEVCAALVAGQDGRRLPVHCDVQVGPIVAAPDDSRQTIPRKWHIYHAGIVLAEIRAQVGELPLAGEVERGIGIRSRIDTRPQSRVKQIGLLAYGVGSRGEFTILIP
jgi:hypothetical protein